MVELDLSLPLCARKEEDIKAVGMSYCGLGMGGWVGWEERGSYHHVEEAGVGEGMGVGNKGGVGSVHFGGAARLRSFHFFLCEFRIVLCVGGWVGG